MIPKSRRQLRKLHFFSMLRQACPWRLDSTQRFSRLRQISANSQLHRSYILEAPIGTMSVFEIKLDSFAQPFLNLWCFCNKIAGSFQLAIFDINVFLAFPSPKF